MLHPTHKNIYRGDRKPVQIAPAIARRRRGRPESLGTKSNKILILSFAIKF